MNRPRLSIRLARQERQNSLRATARAHDRIEQLLRREREQRGSKAFQREAAE
jgi:hypothetical protein